MLRSLIRPALVFITMVSPSRRYHIVVSWGVPSLLIVASTAKRRSLRKARAFSDNVVDIIHNLLKSGLLQDQHGRGKHCHYYTRRAGIVVAVLASPCRVSSSLTRGSTSAIASKALPVIVQHRMSCHMDFYSVHRQLA